MPDVYNTQPGSATTFHEYLSRAGRVTFDYLSGARPPDPEPERPGHRGQKVGAFGERVVCETCHTICVPDYGLRAYVNEEAMHIYPFAEDPADTQAMSLATWERALGLPTVSPESFREPEPAQDAPGRPEEPEVAPVTVRARAEAFRAAKGIAEKPRAMNPSRQDRSAEYAGRRDKARAAARAARSAIPGA